MSDKNEVQFVLFHGIDQFMLPEYRHEVLVKVVGHLDELTPDRRGKIQNQIKRYVRLPGFRNSMLAPLAIKVKGCEAAFEKRPDFVAQVLMAWSELHPELRQQIYDLLVERKWELLPLDADRTKLPGFIAAWPKEETYDVLDAAYKEKYPESQAHEYDVRLMIVWMSGRLPYDMDEEEVEEEK